MTLRKMRGRSTRWSEQTPEEIVEEALEDRWQRLLMEWISEKTRQRCSLDPTLDYDEEHENLFEEHLGAPPQDFHTWLQKKIALLK
jgi:hypothetical protein